MISNMTLGGKWVTVTITVVKSLITMALDGVGIFEKKRLLFAYLTPFKTIKGATTLGIMTLSITTFSITILSVMTYRMTINKAWHSA